MADKTQIAWAAGADTGRVVGAEGVSMITKAQIQAYLALEDTTLADLYSEWSEEFYAAGWYTGGEPQFAQAILAGGWRNIEQPLDEYEKMGVAVIRGVLEAALKKMMP